MYGGSIPNTYFCRRNSLVQSVEQVYHGYLVDTQEIDCMVDETTGRLNPSRVQK